MTLNRASVRAGYSLVEVMVVLAVIAMLAGAAALTLPAGTPAAQRAADRLALDLMRAERAAITSGDFIGLTLDHDGYAFTRFDGAEWQADHTSGLRPVQFGDGVFLRSEQESGEGPAFWFDPTGVNEAAEFVLEDGVHRVRVTFESGQVRLAGEGA
ncbi:MAG: type II secretion system protein GspH [Maricaulis sp.]|jgi:general secretion pathway protein H|nr:type II secretion system protein GspH [Maricaulis sp.]MAL11736.1 type II secretion system protein GspH [Maricaulis sp.]HAQ36099.1 type II secretion system protein GspH [Alphaproteobacteria bacterium]|tara:strand:- start:321 stop:788 length:468 start_codon:yes stop_codon:yes gene_type:complete